MHKISELKHTEFPYTKDTNCYIAVDKVGNVCNFSHNRKGNTHEIQEMYNRAIRGEIKIYAAWVGNSSTEMYEVDNLPAFANAFGLERKIDNDKHTHSLTWEVEDDNSKALSVLVHLKCACGCDLSSKGINYLDTLLYRYFRWKVAKSKGYGGSGENAYVYVHKSSILSKKGEYNMRANINDGHLHSFKWGSWLIAGKQDESFIDILFNCGCKLNENNLQGFKEFAKSNLGWEIIGINTEDYNKTLLIAKTESMFKLHGEFNIN